MKKPLRTFTLLALLGAIVLAGVTYIKRDALFPQPDPSVAAVSVKPETLPVSPPQTQAPAPTAVAIIRPSFDAVNVEPTGEAVIAGHSNANVPVSLLANGSEVGTSQSNDSGAFVITPPKPLSPGPSVLSLQAMVDGKPIMSEQTAAVDVKGPASGQGMVAILKPDEPTKLVQSPTLSASDQKILNGVIIETVDYDDKGTNVFGGRGPAASTIQIYIDNQLTGSTRVGEDRRWKVAGNADLSIGHHKVRADEVGSDGKVKSRFEIPFYREDPARLALNTKPVVSLPMVTTQQNVQVTEKGGSAKVTAKAIITKPIETAPALPATPPPAVEAVVKPATPQETPVAAAPAETTPQAAAPSPKTPELKTPATPEAIAPEPKVTESKPTLPETTLPQTATTEQSPPLETPQAPAVAVAPSSQPDAEKSIIVIQPGNNLWTLSRKLYGRGTKYTVIYEANKDNIRDPGLIYPGQVFVTPGSNQQP